MATPDPQPPGNPADDEETEFEQYRSQAVQSGAAHISFKVFDGEWLLRSCLLAGAKNTIRTFSSKGFLLNPIHKSYSDVQIIDLIRFASLALQIRPEWKSLPKEWLTSPNVLFPNEKHVSIFIPLRTEIVAGPDGDGYTDFHLEPVNPGSPLRKIYPRCVMLSGLKIPSFTTTKSQDGGVTVFLQFLPSHWCLDHKTEVLYFRNFPLDTSGGVTRLLLHYIDEFISFKLHLINFPIEYSLAMFPVQVTPNRLEGFAVVLLPPLRPGENLHLLDGLLSAVGLTDSLPVVLSFGWTRLLMGNNRSELMRVDYLSSLPSTPPLVMVVTGVEKGTSLCALLSALWQDSHYSPDLFKHIGGIFLDRSALYSANPGYFVEKALRAYGHSDSLNLVLSSDVDPQHICRPTIGQAISSLLGLDAQGIRLVPDHTRVPPSSLSMFSRLLALHRSLRPKAMVSANRGLTSTPPSNPRMPRGPPSSSQKLKALTVVDADLRGRYSSLVDTHPLMSALIPAGRCYLPQSPPMSHGNLLQLSGRMGWIQTHLTEMEWLTSTRMNLMIITNTNFKICAEGSFSSYIVINEGLPPTVVSLLDQSGSSSSPFDEDDLEYVQYRQSVVERPLQGQRSCLVAHTLDDEEDYLAYRAWALSPPRCPPPSSSESPSFPHDPDFLDYCVRVGYFPSYETRMAPTILSNGLRLPWVRTDLGVSSCSIAMSTRTTALGGLSPGLPSPAYCSVSPCCSFSVPSVQEGLFEPVHGAVHFAASRLRPSVPSLRPPYAWVTYHVPWKEVIPSSPWDRASLCSRLEGEVLPTSTESVMSRAPALRNRIQRQVQDNPPSGSCAFPLPPAPAPRVRDCVPLSSSQFLRSLASYPRVGDEVPPSSCVFPLSLAPAQRVGAEVPPWPCKLPISLISAQWVGMGVCVLPCSGKFHAQSCELPMSLMPAPRVGDYSQQCSCQFPLFLVSDQRVEDVVQPCSCQFPLSPAPGLRVEDYVQQRSCSSQMSRVPAQRVGDAVPPCSCAFSLLPASDLRVGDAMPPCPCPFPMSLAPAQRVGDEVPPCFSASPISLAPAPWMGDSVLLCSYTFPTSLAPDPRVGDYVTLCSRQFPMSLAIDPRVGHDVQPGSCMLHLPSAPGPRVRGSVQSWSCSVPRSLVPAQRVGLSVQSLSCKLSLSLALDLRMGDAVQLWFCQFTMSLLPAPWVGNSVQPFSCPLPLSPVPAQRVGNVVLPGSCTFPMSPAPAPSRIGEAPLLFSRTFPVPIAPDQRLWVCVKLGSGALPVSFAPAPRLEASLPPCFCAFPVSLVHSSCVHLVPLAATRWVGVAVQPCLYAFSSAVHDVVFSSISLIIPGQDPIPCLGEGDGKGDPPCRFVPQGGPGCRAPPCRYPSLGSQGGPGTREDPPLRSPWEGGGTESSYSAPGTTGPDPPPKLANQKGGLDPTIAVNYLLVHLLESGVGPGIALALSSDDVLREVLPCTPRFSLVVSDPHNWRLWLDPAPCPPTPPVPPWTLSLLHRSPVNLLSGGGRRPRALPSLSPLSSHATLSSCQSDLALSPVPVRPLDTIRSIPGITPPVLDVGVADTLLPFTGEGLFTRALIHFPAKDPATQRRKRWRLSDLVICSYEGVWISRCVGERSDYQSNYCHAVDKEWIVDAQDYRSCYGRFINEHFDPRRVNCRIVVLKPERRLVVVAIPDVPIVPGAELYTSYGLIYWTDLLRTLDLPTRLAILRRYSEDITQPFLDRAGITGHGELLSQLTPSILSFTQPVSPTPGSALYFTEDVSVPVGASWRLVLPATDFRTHCVFPLDSSFEDKLTLLREFVSLHPLLMLHTVDCRDWYYACNPDGSCGAQLALLYRLLPGDTWGAHFSQCTNSHWAYLQFYRRQKDHSRVLTTVQDILSGPCSPSLRRKLMTWAQGLQQGQRSPLMADPDELFLTVDDVMEMIPHGTAASLYVELEPDELRLHHGFRRSALSHSWAQLTCDRRFPDRYSQFTLSELQQILQTSTRASVLRGRHFYPLPLSWDLAEFHRATDTLLRQLLLQFNPAHSQQLSPAPELTTEDVSSPESSSAFITTLAWTPGTASESFPLAQADGDTSSLHSDTVAMDEDGPYVPRDFLQEALEPMSIAAPEEVTLPSGSLLRLPGRPLTLADFPSPDLPRWVPPPLPALLPCPPQFVPPTPVDLAQGALAPVGLWLNPEARRRSGLTWSALLQPVHPVAPILGYQELQTTGGPQSLLTAYLGSLQSDSDTVLSLWKRLEVFLGANWTRVRCLPTDQVTIDNYTFVSISCRSGLSLLRISGLTLPRVPSLLELFQRRSVPRIHPVLYYLLSGIYEGPIHVIDCVTNTVTLYLMDLPTTLHRPRHRRPPLVLFDHRGYVCGSTPPLYGPYFGPFEAPVTLVPFSPQLDPMATPPLEREILGAPCLDEFLRHAPDAFEFHMGGSPSVEDFRVIFFNVNGMDGFKLTEILTVMLLQHIDIVVLIDARIDSALHRVFLTEIHTKLGQRSKLLSSYPLIPEAPTGSRVRVGGNAFILNERWSSKFIEHSSDDSRLCLVDSICVAVPTGVLRLIATYWPYPPPNGSADSSDQKLFSLTHRYLSTKQGTQSPLLYARQTVSALALQHMRHPGNHVLLGGDFNSTWRGRRHDGGGYSAALGSWARDGGWRSWRDDIPDLSPPITRPTPRLTTGTEIDHVLVLSPLYRMAGYGAGTGSGWVGLSDHRPLLVSFTIPTDHLLLPRFTPSAGQQRIRYLRKFTPSKPQLQQFRDAFDSRSPLPCLLTPAVAEAHLDHLTALSLQSAPTRKKIKKRNRKKELWSPIYAALQAQLRALLRIQQRLGLLPCRRSFPPWNSAHDLYIGISAIISEWEMTVQSLKWPDGTPAEVWEHGFSPEEWRTQDFSNRLNILHAAVRDFGRVRNALHGRKRKELASLQSHHIRQREEAATCGHLHRSIQSVLGEIPFCTPLECMDPGDRPLPTSKEEVHRLITEQFEAHFHSPATEAPDLHDGALSWDVLMHESYEEFAVRHQALGIPPLPSAPLRRLWQALRHSPSRHLVEADLSPLLVSAPSLAEFKAAIANKSGHSAGGPSGLLYDHIKCWSPDVVEEAYSCLCVLWTARHVPEAWLWKWLVPLPKGTSNRLADLRPIMLMEVLRKLWTGLIVRRIVSSLLKHNVLCPTQHAYLPSRGTDTANIQLLNALEEAWQHRSHLYGSSWDMKKAFDSVSRPLIILCWQRLGVPRALAEWLVALDLHGHAVVRTDFALETLVQEGFSSLLPLAFSPERGTGQGDIHSPFTWLAVFDVLLTLLDQDQDSQEHIYLPKPDGTTYRAKDVCYADDLQSVAQTLRALQRMADLVSVFALVFNLHIATHKLRVFHYCGLDPPPPPEFLVIHVAGWTPVHIPIRTSGVVKSLGVEYPINPRDHTSFDKAYQSLRTSLLVLARRRASASLITKVMTLCLLNRGAYVGILSSWSLQQCRLLDKLFAQEFRRRTKNAASSQEENIFQPTTLGGLGFVRPSIIIQERKLSLMQRALQSSDPWTRWAMEALLRRGHPCPYNVHQPVLSLTDLRAGFWVSSLIAYGASGRAVLSHQQASSCPDLAPMSPLHGLVGVNWSTHQSHYILSQQYHMFLDLAQWQENLGRWAWRHLPDFLRSSLDTLPLWSPDAPIPLLPGQSWHVAPVGFLRTSRWVIEILDILPRLALGEVSIVFRKWALPHSMVSPLEGSVLSNNPVLQLYSGPLHAETWRLAIFPPGTTAHRLRLETVPWGRGVAEPSSLSNLPSRVRIRESVPSLLPNSICTPSAEVASGRNAKPATVLHVYITQHTQLRASPLYEAVMSSPRLHRMCVLSTLDHVHWDSLVYEDLIPANQDNYHDQTVALTGLLRALKLYDEATADKLIVHLSDRSLVDSVISPPLTYAHPPSAALHKLVQSLLSSSVEVQHRSVPSLSSVPQSLPLRGMFLSSAYAHTGLSQQEVLDISFSGNTESSFLSQPLLQCVPLDYLTGTWSWRDEYSGSYLLDTLKSRSLLQARLRAQEQRDFDRSRRGDPPCWTDVTLKFASVVLNLSHLPIPSRAYFERHLFERHLLVGHNRAKGAKSNEERLRLGSCKLCGSFFSQEEETYDHIYRLCRHPLLCAARAASDYQLAQYRCALPIEERIVPKVCQLVRDINGHRICLGNWASCQLRALDAVLLPQDSPGAIRTTLLELSPLLVERNTAIWEAWREASYTQAVADQDDPAGSLSAARLYQPYRPYLSRHGKARFYAVRAGRQPGVYLAWKDAREQVRGFSRADHAVFSSREEAAAYVAKVPVVPSSPIPDVVASIFTDGSASVRPPFSAGWGFHVCTLEPRVTLYEDCGPVILQSDSSDYHGATRLTNNAGELTALIRAFQWILVQPKPREVGSRGYNIYTDSDYSQKCLLYPRKNTHSNRQLIQLARQLLDQVRTITSIAIIWTKAHSRSLSALSIGNKAADALALKGRQPPPACSPPSLSPSSQRQWHGRRGSSVTSLPSRKRRRLDSGVSPHLAFHLSDSPVDIIPSPLPPDGGDIVDD